MAALESQRHLHVREPTSPDLVCRETFEDPIDRVVVADLLWDDSWVDLDDLITLAKDGAALNWLTAESARIAGFKAQHISQHMNWLAMQEYLEMRGPPIPPVQFRRRRRRQTVSSDPVHFPILGQKRRYGDLHKP